MRSKWLWVWIGCVALLTAATSARADYAPDFYDYDALIDVDNNTSTGCTVALHDANFNGTVSGVEFIVTARVKRFATNASVDQVFLRHCVSGTMFTSYDEFDDGDWPVGLQAGIPVPAPYNLADVVEFYVPLMSLGNPGVMRFYFHATQTASLVNDVLLTTNGQDVGSPIVFPSGQTAPAISKLALAVCALLLTGGAWWGLRRRYPLASTLLAIVFVSSIAIAAWALTIVLDGQIGDWIGVPRAGTDAVNDSSIGDPAEDIAAVFVTADAQNLYFRFDQVNLAPVVCGDGIIESGEYCETTADCMTASCDETGGASCSNIALSVAGGAAQPPQPCTCSNCMCTGDCMQP